MRPLSPRSDILLDRGPGRLALLFGRTSRRLQALTASASQLSLPRFGAVAFAVVGSAVVYGVVVGGHTGEVLDGFGQPLGFAIDKVAVHGNSETSEIDVLQALWQTGSQTLLSLDPTAARQTLEAMPWIDRASVSKIFPDRVEINLDEHRPYAIWQSDGAFFVVNREGKKIVPYLPGRFDALPVVVGTGAAGSAAGIIDDMEAYPELRARVRAYIRVGGRRWDLELKNGVVIRLPEEKPIEAVAEVVRMERQNTLLDRDIAMVDMRLSDRVVVRLTDDSLKRRKERLEERAKLIKRLAKDKPV
ncbi:cell division protein FtsQ/DivIB [Jiella sonneratiae]|uniref:Cell division protein FtsQ n=1 Tax=Jiella sonneratiae TaxID=2816856 RepID=A0ABS3IY36_9HYPH|nr:FtsQ-type POTRA domain-containing protein [Jiella sonneratiae]MBO0902313.1 FtsQ-type POTRA domain-containing protein [Jiella sonneratiae]